MFGDGYNTKFQFTTGFGVFVLYDLYKEFSTYIFPMIFANFFKFSNDSKVIPSKTQTIIDAMLDGHIVAVNKKLYTVTHNDITNQLTRTVDNIHTEEEYNKLRTFILDLQDKLNKKIKLSHVMLYRNKVSIGINLQKRSSNDNTIKVSISICVYCKNELMLMVQDKN